MQITDSGFDPGLETAVATNMSATLSYRNAPHLEPPGLFVVGANMPLEIVPVSCVRIADVVIIGVAKKAYQATKNFLFIIDYAAQHPDDDRFYRTVEIAWNYFLSELERQVKAFAVAMPAPNVGDTTAVQDVWVASADAPKFLASRRVIYSLNVTYQYYFI